MLCLLTCRFVKFDPSSSFIASKMSLTWKQTASRVALTIWHASVSSEIPTITLEKRMHFYIFSNLLYIDIALKFSPFL